MKPTGVFRFRKGASDGLTSWCRSCLNEASKFSMREHLKKPGVRERFREKDKRRYHEVIKQTPELLEAERARKREAMRNRTPDQRAAFKAYLTEYNARPGKREARTAYVRAWQAANPELVRAGQARYHATPKGKANGAAQARKWRALMKGAKVCDLTHGQWLAIIVQHGGRCAYCGCKPRTITMDHVTPLSRGGDHTASNVVPACLSCNSRKNDRTLAEFLAAG